MPDGSSLTPDELAFLAQAAHARRRLPPGDRSVEPFMARMRRLAEQARNEPVPVFGVSDMMRMTTNEPEPQLRPGDVVEIHGERTVVQRQPQSMQWWRGADVLTFDGPTLTNEPEPQLRPGDVVEIEGERRTVLGPPRRPGDDQIMGRRAEGFVIDDLVDARQRALDDQIDAVSRVMQMMPLIPPGTINTEALMQRLMDYFTRTSPSHSPINNPGTPMPHALPAGAILSADDARYFTALPELVGSLQNHIARVEGMADGHARQLAAMNERIRLLEDIVRRHTEVIVSLQPVSTPVQPVAPVAPVMVPAGSPSGTAVGVASGPVGTGVAAVPVAGPVVGGTVPPAHAATAPAGVTVEQLRAALQVYGSRHSNEMARQLIQRVGGAATVSSVPADRRQAVIDAINAASSLPAAAPAAAAG